MVYNCPNHKLLVSDSVVHPSYRMNLQLATYNRSVPTNHYLVGSSCVACSSMCSVTMIWRPCNLNSHPRMSWRFDAKRCRSIAYSGWSGFA
eukprot:9094262-Pyramimonas_sp.AAC.1